MNQDHKPEGKQSFIAAARREQIIEAAVQTLDDIGYVNASLAKIAKQAGISTALISYHFSDKNDLMNHLLIKLVERSSSYILERVNQGRTPEEKLEAYIAASLAYQVTHPAHQTALIEIIFNARTPEQVPYYKLGAEEDEEDALMSTLHSILREGQQQGVFGNFHVTVMANVIQGSIGEYMLNTSTKDVDLETYSSELISIIQQATKKQ
ncbi:TetR family transcriptional regulator [Paenibacillus sp. SC116]|uniref:TetR/AcrR family transcriptional regulator n=1 Tax=Paenibacillus sp. SC116 TaxID=2968986 RepID=UPI00215A5275|nr:TetR family transcriptional regulator [Paenibacillus sp. SC116]MCR8843504.1 TetR family transcriptional regulator [Paenibacillus sp. SC116]